MAISKNEFCISRKPPFRHDDINIFKDKYSDTLNPYIGPSSKIFGVVFFFFMAMIAFPFCRLSLTPKYHV